MILDQQNKLMHSYYQLDTKFKEVKKENKSLRNEFVDLKKSLKPRFHLLNKLSITLLIDSN